MRKKDLLATKGLSKGMLKLYGLTEKDVEEEEKKTASLLKILPKKPFKSRRGV